MFCFFRYYSLPGLYLAEIHGPTYIHHLDYMDGWNIAALALFSVVAAVELVKWTRATPGFFLFLKKSILKTIIFSSSCSGFGSIKWITC